MISPLAVVETNNIGTNVSIYEFAVIRKDVKIGNNVVIHPHSVIENGVTINDNVEVFPGTYIGKEPKGAGALARKLKFDKTVEIGLNCSIGPNAVIFYDVIIGNNTLIGDGASIREQSRIGSYSIIGRYVTVNYNTLIGNNVKIMDHSWLAGNMVIEDNVFISGCVGTSNDNNLGKHGYNEGQIIGPYIENGAVIGVGANLLPNVKIGAHSVIGAGTVVTKNVEPNSVVIGVPGKVSKYING